MKKALSVLLTAAMAASMMAGCGSSSDGAASGTTTDNGAAAGTESAGAAAADGAAFKIGGIGPTTGAAAIYGTAVMKHRLLLMRLTQRAVSTDIRSHISLRMTSMMPRNPSMLTTP